MARRQKITAQIMDDLFIDAMGGDYVALNEYKEYARKLAKQVNQQMLEAERAGATEEAYNRAQSFLGERRRFRESVQNQTIGDLQRQVDEMLAYRSSKEYSIPYTIKAQEQFEENLNALQAAGIDVTDRSVAWNVNELFKTDAWKEYKKAHGKSTNLIQAAADAFENGATVDDFVAAYNDYSAGREDSPDLISSFERVAEWRI